MSGERIGSRVRIILSGGFHYSGKIIREDDLFIVIYDKFSHEVSLNKNDIQVLEVLE